MKKLLLLFTLSLSLSVSQAQYEDMPIDCLVEALIQVESRGDSTAKGDRGWAVGVLQIWPIMVREVNRIQEKNGSNVRYGYNDRYSVKKSIEMFHIWREYYHSDSNWETIARCWNGGPSGSSHHRTKCYWNKVRRELDLLAYYH
tara:strand:- start:815 stop:1246 length:432 start_codon:yes stop_codon:yes gene_type:complete